MSFAALQSRVNSAVLARLSDSATLNGVAVSGRFLDESTMALSFISGDKPVFEKDGIDEATDHRGKTLISDGRTFTVRESARNYKNKSMLLTLEES